MNYSSKEIIDAIKNGDPMGQMEVLYKNEYPKIRKYVTDNSGSDDDAKDIFQDALITLFNYVKLDKYDESKEIGGFMYIVAMNNWKKKNRNNLSTSPIMEETLNHQDDQDVVESMASEEKRNVITALFNTLGENCKEILTNIIFYKMSLKELAEKMGYDDSGTIKTRHYKCKQRLIKALDKSPEYLKILRE